MPHPKRVKNWIIAGGVLAVSLILGTISLALMGYETGFLGFVAGLLMAVIPVPFYVAFALWIDRFEPEPPLLLLLAFLWGASIAIFVALVFNSSVHAVLALIGGASAGSLSSIVSAPFVEESAKGLALLLLVWWQREEFDNVTDGIVYATMVGLGFAMTENIQYYGQAVAHHSGANPFTIFFVRGMMGPFCHPLFTSMTGIGLGLGRESSRREVKIIAPLAGLGVAMALHFIWNLSASFGAFFFVAYLVIMVPAFLAVIVVALFSLRREARIIRLHLAALQESGLLSSGDLEVLTSVRGRIGASARALQSGGIPRWRLRRRFDLVATDLAFHSWRRSRGEREESTVEFHSSVAESVSSISRIRRELGLPEVAERVPEKGLGTLVCTAGALAGARYPIGPAGVEIGRDPASANLVVQDKRVSKRHVWVGERNGSVVAVDRGSTNGTFVNQPNARLRESVLAPGDVLIISEDVARFQFEA